LKSTVADCFFLLFVFFVFVWLLFFFFVFVYFFLFLFCFFVFFVAGAQAEFWRIFTRAYGARFEIGIEQYPRRDTMAIEMLE